MTNPQSLRVVTEKSDWIDRTCKELAGRMKSFLQKQDPWGHGVSLWLIAAVAFLLPLIAWSLSHVHMENDVAGWLPRNDPQAQILSWYENLFPSEDRILVSWDGCSLTDERLAKFADTLQGVQHDERREGGSPYISEVKQPADLLKRMMKEGVPLEEGIRRIMGLLAGKGPLCIRLTDAGRLRGDYMQKEILRIARSEIGSDVTIVQQSLPLPSSEGLDVNDEQSWKLHDALTAYVREVPLYDLQLSWPRMHIDAEKTKRFREALAGLQAPDTASDAASSNCIDDTFFVSGAMAAVSVGLSEAGVADRTATIKDVQNAAVTAGIPLDQLRMGGRPVASTALNTAVKHAGWNRDFPLYDLPHRSPILLSFVITFVLSMLVLKSIRLTILVQTVSTLCAIGTVALVPPTGGSMNMVLVVMPTLLAVLTTSAAIHLCNYWKNSGISDPAKSVHHAASIAWLPCALASGTTAIGLGSLTVSSLVPVRDFGIYASIGCGISFVCALYILPSLMLFWRRTPPRPDTIDTGAWKWLGRFIARHGTAVALVCIAGVISCSAGLQYFRTETKVIRYFPDDSRLVTDYNFLEENLSGIVSVDTIVKFDEASQKQIPFMERARKVMEIQEALRQHPEVSGTLSLASFLDLSERDTSSMTRIQRMQAKRKESLIGERIHDMLLSADKQKNSLSSMLAVAQQDGDWRTKGDALLNQKGDELWRITCQSSIMSDYDYDTLTKELDKITREKLALIGSPGTGHIVTGLIPIFLRTQQALLESLISSFGLAFGVIAVVMAVLLRSVSASFFAMMPNLMPVATMFGLLAWFDIRIDIGTMITASVALGIAVDGTLHLMTWFQMLVKQGVPRQEAVAQSLEHCGPALWQTSAAIGIGMLALFPVELLLISRFGWIMAGMIFAALIGDVIFLPSLLAGPLGAILERAARPPKSPGQPNQHRDRQSSADPSSQPDASRSEAAGMARQPSTDGAAASTGLTRIPGGSTSSGYRHPAASSIDARPHFGPVSRVIRRTAPE